MQIVIDTTLPLNDTEKAVLALLLGKPETEVLQSFTPVEEAPKRRRAKPKAEEPEPVKNEDVPKEEAPAPEPAPEPEDRVVDYPAEAFAAAKGLLAADKKPQLEELLVTIQEQFDLDARPRVSALTPEQARAFLEAL